METTKKITRATVKSFIRKNDNLYINVTSNFDGMTDCCQPVRNGFMKVEETNMDHAHTFGIRGAWFVGQSRDWLRAYEDENYKGYEVSNSCGRFIIATLKN